MEKMRKQFYKCLLFIAVLITGTQMAQAQQKIGTNPGTLEPSAVLELGSSDTQGAKKGFLGPRVNLPSATTYSLGPVGTAAVDGMIVYAIGTSGLTAGYYVWQNSKWNLIQVGAGVTASNGLSLNAGSVELGGALTKATIITTTPTNTLTLAGIQAKAAETATLALNDSLLVLSNTGRLVYRAASSVSPISSVSTANGLSVTANGQLVLAAPTAASITGGADVTAGSNKVTLGGTPAGAALNAFSIDVNEANLNLANIGGTLSKATTITTTATNTLTLAGIQAKTAETATLALNDSLLVLSNTGRLVYRAASSVSPISSVSTANGLSVTANGQLVLAAPTAASITGGAPVTATSKITLTGTPGTAALNAFGIDVNEGNLNLANIGGTLPIAKITPAGTAGQVLTSNGTSAPTFQAIPSTGAANGLTLNATTKNIELGGTLTKVTTINQGTAPDPAYNLNFSGSASTIFGTAGVASTLNSGRLSVVTSGNIKEAITVMNDTLSTVGNIAGISFRTQGSSEKSQYGFTANIRAIQTQSTSPGGIGDLTTDLTFATYPGVQRGAPGPLERMRILGNGNVGIGTNAPTAPLQISWQNNSTSIMGGLIAGNDDIITASHGLVFRNTPGGALIGYVHSPTYTLGNGGTGQITPGPAMAAGSGKSISFYTNPIGSPINLSKQDSIGIMRMNIGNDGNVAINPTPYVGAKSTLEVNGSFGTAINKVSTAYIATDKDYTILANAFTAGFTITLPAPGTCKGRTYTIRKTDESANAITFTFAGITSSNAIRVTDTSAAAGSGSYINTLNYVKTLRIQSDGIDWYLID